MKLVFLIGTFFLTFTSTFASDSLRTETVNGKQLMVYRVEKGQTLYAIARKYSISVNEIKALNPGLSQLKIGSEIYLPTKAPAIAATPSPASRGTDEASDQVTHKVQKGETLYKISKRYNVPVAEITRLNEINGGLKVGQELIIPQKESATPKQSTVKPTNAPSPTATINVTPKSEKKVSASGYPAITEIGVAKLDENLSNESVYLVQHKTAVIGTLLLVKNKENGNSVHAKVIGNTNTSETSLLVVNKRVFEKLEPKTNAFAVEIFYTPEQ